MADVSTIFYPIGVTRRKKNLINDDYYHDGGRKVNKLKTARAFFSEKKTLISEMVAVSKKNRSHFDFTQ